MLTKEFEEKVCKKCIFYDVYEHKPCQKYAGKRCKDGQVCECFNYIDIKIFKMKKD